MTFEFAIITLLVLFGAATIIYSAIITSKLIKTEIESEDQKDRGNYYLFKSQYLENKLIQINIIKENNLTEISNV